ncbi:DUF7059 domain-containing protein [Glaciihabitans arcticus]|nr:methyltransferase [Glaciihabitans arcticus]
MTSALFPLLRDDLAAAAFTVDALGTLWGEDAAAALHRGQRVPARRALARVAGGGPLGTLATLFVLGLESSRASAEGALPRLGVEGAERLGLVALEGDSVRPLLDLRPYSFVDARGAGAWWIASDLGELALGGAIPEHHVLGVGGASTTLSGLMLSEAVDSVLDLGTGCGIQALHASRHARRVVATDISQRALDLAAFNAALNDVSNIELRLGSLFEPVAGERFDQIVSNPPFVITPRTEGVPAYEYRDGGLVGDALVEQVVRESADHLTPGGVVQLLGNWEYRSGDDGLERVQGWLENVSLDAWVIERETQDAALYAETWIRDGGTRPGTPNFDRLYAAWLDDFEERGVTGVGFGYLTLRAPLGGTVTLRRFERVDGALGRNEAGLGAHIAASLAAHDAQLALSDADLARIRLVVAGDVTEERYYWPGDEDPTVMDLRQGGGFGRTEPLGTALAAVVGASDGELSVGAICAAIAELLGVDETELLAEVLPEIRRLLVTGFVAVA